MIHHVSIPVREPAHVAEVLTEISGWKARPFMGPVPGAVMLLSEDEHGTAIELYPLGAVFKPGEDPGHVETGAAGEHGPYGFHFLWSLDVDPDKVLKVFEREGWRAVRCWRGPPHRPLFELIEVWIENRLMIEIATPSMLPDYVRIATAEAHDRLGAEMRAAHPEPA